MNYRLAIFDFDGTLANSWPFFLSVFNDIADQHNFRRVDPEQAERLRHVSAREVMRHVGMPLWKLPFASRTFIERMRANTAQVPLFDGVREALHTLDQAGMQLAVVSSNSEHNVRAVLGPELSPLMRQYACGMSIFGKSAHIRRVVRRAGVAPSQVLYVGDQVQDAHAARQAGVAFGAVSWGYAPPDALRRIDPAHEFVSPRDLVSLLHR